MYAKTAQPIRIWTQAPGPGRALPLRGAGIPSEYPPSLCSSPTPNLDAPKFAPYRCNRRPLRITIGRIRLLGLNKPTPKPCHHHSRLWHGGLPGPALPEGTYGTAAGPRGRHQVRHPSGGRAHTGPHERAAGGGGHPRGPATQAWITCSSTKTTPPWSMVMPRTPSKGCAMPSGAAGTSSTRHGDIPDDPLAGRCQGR